MLCFNHKGYNGKIAYYVMICNGFGSNGGEWLCEACMLEEKIKKALEKSVRKNRTVKRRN